MFSFAQKKNRCALAAFAMFSALASVPASAEMLTLQTPEDDAPGYLSANGLGLHNGDTFSFSVDSEVTGIAWWGTEASGDGFVVRVFDSLQESAAPLYAYAGAVSGQVTDPALQNDAQGALYRYSLGGLSLNLDAGVTYLLSVSYEGASGEWFWQSGFGGDGASYFRGDDAEPWAAGDLDLAFSIEGIPTSPIPEPGIVALFGAGLVTLMLARRRVATI